MTRSTTAGFRNFLWLALAVGGLPASAQDTTPYNCEQFTVAKTGSWIAPIARDLCETQEARNGQAFARIAGKPRPSTAVYELPGYGSAEAKRSGIACIGGTAMQRVKNGWVQLVDLDHDWLRCRDLQARTEQILLRNPQAKTKRR